MSNKPILINNSRLMTELKSSLFIEYNKERTGVHVSDILLCMRETVFRKLRPEAVTDRELGYYTSGRAIHEAIQNLAKHFPKYEVEKEINYQVDDVLIIKAHIDLYDKENNIPIEAKTVRNSRLGTYNKATRSWSEETPKSFNVEQLKMYMSLTNADIGYIIYQLLLDYDNFPFRIYEVKMTKEERKDMLDKMVGNAYHLQINIDERTPQNTKHIFNDKDKNWKCAYCKYNQECTSMRNTEFARNRK